MTAATLPAGSLEVCHDLDDGASYRLAATAPGITTLVVRDAEDDVACVALDRAGARRLIEDIELVAGLRPTAPVVDRATALAGSVRILFERLAELDRTDPAGVAQVVAAIAAHLRSSRPLALLEVGP